jgi:type IX secretion system PorP/SprF family membrane protein
MSGFFNLLHSRFKLIVLTIGIFLMEILSFHLFSQDIVFSLYQSSPLYLNPANTGNFTGDWRIAGNYRNQFIATAEPFRTACAGFDGHIYIFKQKIGIGFYAMSDESGVGGLSFNNLYASLAYQFEISKNFFSLGFQAGYVFGSVNSWGIWDYSTGTFNGPNGETNFGDHVRYADMNLGLQWKRTIRKIEPEIGLTIAHLNQPKKSFFSGEEKEDSKMTLDVRSKINISDEFFITPAVLYQENAASTILMGMTLGYALQGNRSSVRQLSAGVYFKKGQSDEFNSYIFTLCTTIRRLDVGISYDMNSGKLSDSAGTMGAFEVSLIYRSISTVLNSYSIPCERY